MAGETSSTAMNGRAPRRMRGKREERASGAQEEVGILSLQKTAGPSDGVRLFVRYRGQCSGVAPERTIKGHIFTVSPSSPRLGPLEGCSAQWRPPRDLRLGFDGLRVRPDGLRHSPRSHVRDDRLGPSFCVLKKGYIDNSLHTSNATIESSACASLASFSSIDSNL